MRHDIKPTGIYQALWRAHFQSLIKTQSQVAKAHFTKRTRRRASLEFLALTGKKKEEGRLQNAAADTKYLHVLICKHQGSIRWLESRL